jgi:GT2 family glycosyltransferase
MSEGLTFSVGISTYNRNDDLVKCLRALEKQTFKDFEVVVVNGGSKEPVEEIIKGFAGLKLKLVHQEKKGIVEARNLAWQRGKGDIACLIDDDLVVSPDWLKQVRETFLSDPKIGGVSGPTIIPAERRASRDFAYIMGLFDTSRNPFLRLAGYLYKELVLENKVYDVGRILASGTFTPGSNYEQCLSLAENVEVDYLEACHMCFSRSLLEKIGGFDYSYTGTGEWNEPDFSFKVRKLGFKLVFNPKAKTEHHISQGGVFKARTYAFERSRNFIIFYMRNVKPNTPNKLVRFSANLFFINAYWCYKFLQTRNPDWLTGLWGTVKSLNEALFLI